MNIARAIISITTFFAAAIFANANAAVIDGNLMLTRCQTHDPLCVGYVAGFVNGYDTGRIGGSANQKQIYCWPEQATYSQGVDIFLGYLKSHPASRHMDASILLTVALREAYPPPCDK